MEETKKKAKGREREKREAVVLCIITDFSERRQLLPARYQRACVVGKEKRNDE